MGIPDPVGRLRPETATLAARDRFKAQQVRNRGPIIGMAQHPRLTGRDEFGLDPDRIGLRTGIDLGQGPLIPVAPRAGIGQLHDLALDQGGQGVPGPVRLGGFQPGEAHFERAVCLAQLEGKRAGQALRRSAFTRLVRRRLHRTGRQGDQTHYGCTHPVHDPGPPYGEFRHNTTWG